MTKLDFSALHNSLPLEKGDYLYLQENTVRVSREQQYRGANVLNAVIKAFNESFKRDKQEWYAIIGDETGQSEGSRAYTKLQRLEIENIRRNNSWCRWLTDWVNWSLSFITWKYESNRFATLEIRQLERNYERENGKSLRINS